MDFDKAVNMFVYGITPLGIIFTHIVLQQAPSRLTRPESLPYICHHSWAFHLALTFGLIPALRSNLYSLFYVQLVWSSSAIKLLNSLALGFVAAQLLRRAFINARDDYRRAMLGRSHGPFVNIRLIRLD